MKLLGKPTIIEDYPIESEVYEEFRRVLRVAKNQNAITGDQYRNALGQFKAKDFQSCYLFLAHVGLKHIITYIERFKSTKFKYATYRIKIEKITDNK